jgi:hypothetical protein
MVKSCHGESDFKIPLYPAAIGHLCGYVNGMNGETQSDPPGALRCFWQAYTRCQAATLILSTPKIPASPYDSVLQAFISFQRSNGDCAVSLVERHIQGDFIPRTCAELIKRGDQLVVTSCGTLGDFAIPLAPHSPFSGAEAPAFRHGVSAVSFRMLFVCYTTCAPRHSCLSP